MEAIKLHVGRRVSNVISSDNVEFVTVPEPEEAVREREYNRRLKRELRERLTALIREKMDELEPVRDQEKKDAYAQGHEAGYRKGYDEAVAEIEPLKGELSQTIRELIEFRQSFLRESENTIVTMALEFAKSIVNREIESGSAVVTGQVEKVIEYVIGEGRLSLHVNPDDLRFFENKKEFIPEEYIERIEVLPDESIERGGCVLYTNSGIIDATIPSQTAALEATVTGGMESESESDTGSDNPEIRPTGLDEPEGNA